MDKITFNRQTYSLLDWLGDCGGLFDALYLFLKVILAPVTTFNMRATLLSKLMRGIPSASKSERLRDHSTKQDTYPWDYFHYNGNSAAAKGKLL